MQSALAFQYLVLAAFVVLGFGFVAVTLTASSLLRPNDPRPEKLETYESGEVPIGSPWIQFRLGYYVYALLFVIFDVETVFLFPWAVAYGSFGVWALAEMAIFIGLLFIGLVYAWKEGALTWR